MPDLPGNLAVRARLAVGNLFQCIPDRLLEGGSRGGRRNGEHPALTFEILSDLACGLCQHLLCGLYLLRRYLLFTRLRPGTGQDCPGAETRNKEKPAPAVQSALQLLGQAS